MTLLDYLDDPYCFRSEAVFQSVKETEFGTAVILDRTIFYPQGGGQPSDTGKIIFPQGVFDVSTVRLDETGTVLHFGTFEKEFPVEGQKATLEVDEDKRRLHVRLHSAGHLIDVAVTKLGLEGLTPTKGFHFAQGSYVEYEGTLENPADYIPALEAALAELVEQDLAVESADLTPQEAAQQHIQAPAGKSVRVVNFEGFEACGCGGTHVRSAKGIGPITIRKIKSKKGITRISYALGE